MSKKRFIQTIDDEVRIWIAPHQCRVFKQLSLPFKLT